MNELSDNYPKFSNFCRSQNSREQRLSRALLKEVILSTKSKSIKVLDIGSSDGRIIPLLLKEFSGKFNNINIELLTIEPDPVPFTNLLEMSISHGFKAMRTDVETFFTQCHERFDLIIGTHVLYHFEDWVHIIENIKKLLNESGQAIFVIDSNESPLYELRTSIVELVGLDQTVQSYGDYRFAKEFRSMLVDQAIALKEVDLASDLEIEGISKQVRDNNLLEILSFLHRFKFNPNGNIEGIKELFMKFSCQEKEGIFKYRIPWKEAIFVINK